MGKYQEFQLPKLYHDALMDWQRRNFPDLSILLKHWDTYFPDEAPYQLNVKLTPLKEDAIEVGAFKGQPKLTRAGDMKGNMLFSAVRIVKAQCSTELGSIQQHCAHRHLPRCRRGSTPRTSGKHGAALPP